MLKRNFHLDPASSAAHSQVSGAFGTAFALGTDFAFGGSSEGNHGRDRDGKVPHFEKYFLDIVYIIYNKI
jgi:hypothetical protein